MSDDDNKTTLVLLPGLDGTGRLFHPLTAALSKCVRTQIVAYPQNRFLSLAEYAQCAASQLPAYSVVLLAESFSGLVALSLLARNDTRINSVIFCAAFAEPPKPILLQLIRLLPNAGRLMQTVPTFFLRKFCLGSQASSDVLILLNSVLAEANSAVLTHRLRLVAFSHAFAKEPSTIPCWYLQAKNDRLVPASAAGWFSSRFKQFQLERMKDRIFCSKPNRKRALGLLAM